MYKPKDWGGLRIKDIEGMNKALLINWKWMILTEKNAL